MIVPRIPVSTPEHSPAAPQLCQLRYQRAAFDRNVEFRSNKGFPSDRSKCGQTFVLPITHLEKRFLLPLRDIGVMKPIGTSRQCRSGLPKRRRGSRSHLPVENAWSPERREVPQNTRLLSALHSSTWRASPTDILTRNFRGMDGPLEHGLRSVVARKRVYRGNTVSCHDQIPRKVGARPAGTRPGFYTRGRFTYGWGT